MTIEFTSGEPGYGACTACGQPDETRFGVCFGCAHDGERRAACRTVLQHIAKAMTNAGKRQWENARYDLSWAWQRLTSTGDYKRGGYFEREYPGYRS